MRRRMQVISAETLEDYIARLQASHDEVVLLFRDLLIRVTSFFPRQGNLCHPRSRSHTRIICR